jgi:hypothetical protein
MIANTFRTSKGELFTLKIFFLIPVVTLPAGTFQQVQV